MIKMVVIDDELWALRGFVSLLAWNELGIEIVGAYQDENEALRTIQETKPDIVVTDVYLNSLKGDEIVKRVHEQYEDTETVMISAFRDFDAVKNAMQYGTFSYIEKPYDRKEVRKTFEKLVKRIESKTESVMTMEKLLQVSCDAKFPYNYAVESEKRPVASDDPETLDIQNYKVQQYGIISLISSKLPMTEEKMKEMKTVYGISRAYSSFRDKERMLTEAHNSRQYNIIYSNDQLIGEIQSYICMNISEQMTLTSLSAKFAISPNYLSGKFKKTVGENLISFINRIKMTESCIKMKNSDKPLTEIALDLGFENYNYFGRIFKRYIGITPEEYRRTMGFEP